MSQQQKQLDELSQVLGLPVLAVEDRLSRETSRKRGMHRWVVDVRSSAGGTWRVGIFDSSDFRRRSTLNAWAWRYGRDVHAPPLTEEDGRRALRLMHEAVEAAEQNKNAEEAMTS